MADWRDDPSDPSGEIAVAIQDEVQALHKGRTVSTFVIVSACAALIMATLLGALWSGHRVSTQSVIVLTAGTALGVIGVLLGLVRDRQIRHAEVLRANQLRLQLQQERHYSHLAARIDSVENHLAEVVVTLRVLAETTQDQIELRQAADELDAYRRQHGTAGSHLRSVVR